MGGLWCPIWWDKILFDSIHPITVLKNPSIILDSVEFAELSYIKVFLQNGFDPLV
jgi:hypothetical protein